MTHGQQIIDRLKRFVEAPERARRVSVSRRLMEHHTVRGVSTSLGYVSAGLLLWLEAVKEE